MSRFRTTILILVALVLLILAGPKVKVDESWVEVSPPQDLNAWLAEKEDRVEGIREGLQKRIVWADSTGHKTRFAIVYLHGFSASSKETYPFSNSIAAELGANLFYTRLAGHGRDGRALGNSTAHEWIQDTVESIRVAEKIGEEIILIGTSTGATLAAWATAQEELSEKISAQIWISPNLAPANSQSNMLLWPWGRVLLKVMEGDTYGWETQNELHDEAGTQQFGSEVLLEMMGLVDVVQHQDFSQITIPTLMVYSPTDEVIDQTVSIGLWDDLGAALKDSMIVTRALDTSNHVIVGDALGPENTMRVAERVLSFIKTATGSPPTENR